MALNIYLEPVDTSPLSKSGRFSNPLGITFDGRLGGTKEIRLYLRNDDPAVRYTNIVLSLQDTDVDSHIDSLDSNYQWKLSEGDTKPTLLDWNNTEANNELQMTDIGEAGIPDTSTFLPFWLYVKVPANLAVQNIRTISFVIEGNEVAI